MDWTSIILAAIGGALGAAIGTLMALPFQSKSTKSIVAVAITILGATLGGRLGPTLLDPYLGGSLRDAMGQTAAVEEQLQALRDDAFFAALIDGGAVSEDELRARLLDAYREGGAEGLKREAGVIGQENGERVFSEYLPRASDADIMEVTRAMTEIMAHLSQTDPQMCYDWLFGAQHGRIFDAVAFGERIGAERENRLHAAFTEAVRNAAETPPETSLKAAQAGVQQAGAAAGAMFTQENVGIITGERPAADEAEAKLACDAMRALYENALEQENAADVLRLLFRG